MKTIQPEPRQVVRPTRIDDPVSALIARLMDSNFVIPGTNIRFGFDSIVDLIPGVGDSAGALVSTVLIAQAARLGVPRVILARMALNVLLNTFIGALPFLGAVLSVFYRSNAMNYALLQRHAGQRRISTMADWWFVGGVIALMLVLVGLTVFGAIILAAKLLGSK
jgi:hypothetical protein